MLELTKKLVAGAPPNETAVAPVKLTPVKITVVLPLTSPLLTLSDDTAGWFEDVTLKVRDVACEEPSVAVRV